MEVQNKPQFEKSASNKDDIIVVDSLKVNPSLNGVSNEMLEWALQVLEEF